MSSHCCDPDLTGGTVGTGWGEATVAEGGPRRHQIAMLRCHTDGMGRSNRPVGSGPHVVVSTTVRDGSVEVVLAGELDLATAPAVRAGLDPHVAVARARLVIDLRGVGFMDCRGLTPLVAAARRVHAAGGVVALRHPGRAVRRLLEVCNVAEVPGLSVEGPEDRLPRASPRRSVWTGCD